MIYRRINEIEYDIDEKSRFPEDFGCLIIKKGTVHPIFMTNIIAVNAEHLFIIW